MIKQDYLPIILVSAVDRQTAENFISDVTAESECRVLEEGGCVWTIQNKYYTADVRMMPLGDGDPVVCDPSLVEAHLIYLTTNECSDNVAWSSRAAAAAATDASVLVCACAGDPPATPPHLRLYEPVRLEGGGGDTDGDGGDEDWDEGTVTRVRDALHAHTWRGLRRRGGGGGEGDGAGGAADEGGWSAEGVERWASVLEAAAAAARLSPASRRRRADALLPALHDALCAALHHDLDDQP